MEIPVGIRGDKPRVAASMFDGGRRERLACACVAIALVLIRSIVPTLYEGFYFDSDQAIVGLMAKHLSEFRGFPLFYYSLNYLLGVQAWIIAPFFWIARPSVAVMRVPLILLNLIAAVWLMSALTAHLRLRPALAFVAALPFIVPTPVVANQLLEVAGASVEPFVYVLLLWSLRRRPVVFGALLAFGSLHREFTIFALPGLAIAEFVDGRRQTAPALKWLARMAGGFGIVWLIVDDLKAHLSGASLIGHALAVRGQMCLDAGWPARVGALLTGCLPILFGGAKVTPHEFRMDSSVLTGSAFAGGILAIALVVAFVRIGMQWRRSSQVHVGFGVYLLTIGVCTAAVYPLSCNIVAGNPPLLRYALLASLIPIGLVSIFLRLESSGRLRSVVAGLLLLWGGMSLIDSGRMLAAAVADPPLNEHRALTDFLQQQHVRYARATYLDAYVVDFLSRERVIVASSDLFRIEEYQKQADEHESAVVLLHRLPCEGGTRVASWCVQFP